MTEAELVQIEANHGLGEPQALLEDQAVWRDMRAVVAEVRRLQRADAQMEAEIVRLRREIAGLNPLAR